MQTAKARSPGGRPSSLEVPQKTSPVTTQTARKLKTQLLETSSPNSASKMPKDRSPKVVDRRSPRSPATERKRPAKIVELETQLAQLQEELKKAKDQLSSSESLKKKAEQDAEEAKKQVAAMSVRLEESEKQLDELSDLEESRLQELRKLSQERDRAWKSELDAVQKQHSFDSAALASAMNEIQKLKNQLSLVAESKAAHAKDTESAQVEIQNLRYELGRTLELVEKLKSQLTESRESEASAVEEVSQALVQLGVAKAMEEAMYSESLKFKETYESLVLELEQSKSQVHSLEEIVGKLQENLHHTGKASDDSPSNNEGNLDRDENVILLDEVKLEASQLRAALEASERRYQEEYIKSTLQIRSAYELIEQAKSESCQRETELDAKLKAARLEVEELKAELKHKESNLAVRDVQKSSSTEREELASGLEDSSVAEDLRATLMDKETELQGIMEENEILKLEIENQEAQRRKLNDEARDLVDAARVAEKEALLKIDHLTEEADKSSQKASRVTEQLDAAQAANSDIEAELRRLKVQADQWRKAAEAAAAMLSTGNNGKYVERTGSMDYHTLGGKLGSPYSEDLDDESPKKRNGNVLKKFGFLLKKGQK